MFEYDRNNSVIIGPAGNLKICSGDEVSLKLAMLLQGECTKVGPLQAAKNFNYSKARYYQIRNSFDQEGVDALIRKKTGPKTNYRRTPEVTKLVIRARYLDPDASAEVIASKLRQDGYQIATRSVERIISEYGLQKKTPYPIPPEKSPPDRNPEDRENPPNGAL